LRTPERTDMALFWSDNTAVQWPAAARALAIDKGLGPADTARMLTLMHVSVADAILACFDAKYHFTFWRPIHAIRRAETDGNPATDADASWTPLLYPNHPNHPEYPAAHACWTTAATETMAAFFGTDIVGFSVDSHVANAEQKTRHYERFSDAAAEVFNARMWGGLHFRHSLSDGAWIGHEVANYVLQNFFRPAR
ncbi:MAG: vanadium-dependent haloperoxidase, partial [Chloroflexi bacterium]|nr:vanadium-dependent haloperoxidase [Chloroflexota bacterium]